MLTEPFPLLFGRLSCEVLFLSDLHLHSGYEDLEALRALLALARPRALILVGDVVNRHARERAPLTPDRQRALEEIGELFAHLRQQAEIVYVRGNHDPMGGTLPGLGDVPSVPEASFSWHGKRFLVTHGHRAVRRSFLHHHMMGSLLALRRHAYRFSPLVLSARLLKLSPFARSLEHLFARRWLRRARRDGYDGVICGHIHIPGLRRRGNHIYANCGDWVDCDTFLALEKDTFLLGAFVAEDTKTPLLRERLPLS